MKGFSFLFTLAVLALVTSNCASAYDPSPLQDFCVAIADPKKSLFVNGKFCKNPELVTADDFLNTGLNIPRSTNNALNSNVTIINVDIIPGLNTLGLTLARIDYGPNGGLNAPHFHPRASEILYVEQGTLYVGFVSSNQDNHRLFTKILNKGDAFAFPVGLIHFQLNLGRTPAVAFAHFNSQNPGVVTVANTVFGSNPPINPNVLTKAFKLDKDTVARLQKQFFAENNNNTLINIYYL